MSRQIRTRPRQAMSPSAVDKLERKILRFGKALRGVRAVLNRMQAAVDLDMLPAIRRAERR